MQERLAWLENNGYRNNGTTKVTRTTKFLMPLIGISEQQLDGHCLNMFINAHLKDEKEMIIYVILDKLNFPEESKHYLELQHLNENFLSFMEEEEEYILEYEIPSHFEEDVRKIIEGKYSKTSDPYKQIMIRVHGIEKDEKDHLCYVYEILHPTDKKRELKAKILSIGESIIDKSLIEEVASKPDLEYEIYKNINTLKEYGFNTNT